MAAEFNVQMAGSLILALPVLVLYIFMGIPDQGRADERR